MTDVKICGLSTPDTLTAAIEAGAGFVGFVFYPKSPRAVSLEVAAYLASYVPVHVRKVGLFVDPSDELLQQTLDAVRLDMLQLHGHESPGRVMEIKHTFGVPVMKALSVSTKDDLAMVPGYEVAADWLLFDAKGTADMPGGNGLPFDWTLLKDFSSTRPWMLAGGLTPENVREALTLLEPDAVDVSSGVETAPGVKDEGRIRAFLQAVIASEAKQSR